MMDVDLIFKRGVTYTLATAALVGVYFALLAVAAALAQARLRSFGIWGLLPAIIVAALLFEPLKRVIQMRVDRLFDRQSYDYRATLIAFGRGLSSFTNLEPLLHAIVDRLPRTLLVDRVAVFLQDVPGQLPPRRPARLTREPRLTPCLDLGFLDFDEPNAGSHLFLENPAAGAAPHPRRADAPPPCST